jgi:hypothetical protein
LNDSAVKTSPGLFMAEVGCSWTVVGGNRIAVNLMD